MSREKNNIGKGVWLASFSLTVLFFLLLVSQAVRSTQYLYKIQALEETIKKREEELRVLEFERDRILSLESIENTARKYFELQAPLEENIIVLPVSDSRS